MRSHSVLGISVMFALGLALLPGSSVAQQKSLDAGALLVKDGFENNPPN